MKNKNAILNFVKVMLLIVIVATTTSVVAQSKDSIPARKEFKNTLKLNISNWVLYDNSYQLSYERITKKNQSIAVFAGYQTFGMLQLNIDNVNFNQDNKRTGFSVGADYRFYLGNINKDSAPRGVYLAPFMTFFQFNSDRAFTYTNPNSLVASTATLNTTTNFTSVGGMLGYQFVIHDRWVIDCVLFGPSVTFYKFKANIDGNINGLDEDSLAAAAIEKLKEKFPLLNELSGGAEIAKRGTQDFSAVGFRYSINIGYRF